MVGESTCKNVQNGGQLTSTQPKSTESNKHAIEREGELILRSTTTQNGGQAEPGATDEDVMRRHAFEIFSKFGLKIDCSPNEFGPYLNAAVRSLNLTLEASLIRSKKNHAVTKKKLLSESTKTIR